VNVKGNGKDMAVLPGVRTVNLNYLLCRLSCVRKLDKVVGAHLEGTVRIGHHEVIFLDKKNVPIKAAELVHPVPHVVHQPEPVMLQKSGQRVALS
jgi:hypothetical protein